MPIFLPILSMESVRIWLILTHEHFDKFSDFSLKVSGKPVRWGWLVRAAPITVPERSLKHLSLKLKQALGLLVHDLAQGLNQPIGFHPSIFRPFA